MSVGNAALLVDGFFPTGIFADFLYKFRYREGLKGGAQRAVLRVNEPKKTGAHSEWARNTAKTH
jgi:hypothetical protein